MHWCFVLLAVLAAVLASQAQDEQMMNRAARSFPYSVSLYRMLGHDRELRPYYGEDDEVAALIDGMNLDQMPRMRRNGEQLKRYACRFKFCRIFDA